MGKLARITTTLIIFNLILFLCSSFSNALTTDQIIRDVEEKLDLVYSYKVVYRLKINNNNQRLTTDGKVVFKRPNKAKIDMMLMLQKPMKQTVVSNGESMLIYMHGLGKATKIRLDTLRDYFGESYFDYQEPNLCSPFSEVDKSTLRRLQDEKLDGENMYVFLAGPSKLQVAQENLPKDSKLKLWISKENGLLYKKSVCNAAGEIIMQYIFKDFVINPIVRDYEFRLSPEENIEISDITDDIRNQMQETLTKKRMQQ